MRALIVTVAVATAALTLAATGAAKTIEPVRSYVLLDAYQFEPPEGEPS